MKFIKTRDVKSPERANPLDSWIDFYVPMDVETITVKEWDNIKIKLWIKIVIPKWYDFQFVNKSGVASKTWMILWAQLVDRGYNWELILNLIWTSKIDRTIEPWMKIIQWVIRPVSLILPEEVSEVDLYTEWAKEDSTRWIGGFGSTWDK